MAEVELTFREVPFAELIGGQVSRAAVVHLPSAALATGKLRAAAALGLPLTLSPADADGVIALLALRAAALRYGGALPIARLAPGSGALLPTDGSGILGCDAYGPMMGPRHDVQSHAATLAIGQAIRLARQNVIVGGALPVDPPPAPPVVVGPEKTELGIAPALAGGLVAGAVLMLAGAGVVGWYVARADGQAVRWRAQEVIAVRRAEVAASLALERWHLEQQTGKPIAPSPLELGAQTDIADLAKAENGSRWTGVGLGALLGALGAGGVVLAGRRLGLEL